MPGIEVARAVVLVDPIRNIVVTPYEIQVPVPVEVTQNDQRPLGPYWCRE